MFYYLAIALARKRRTRDTAEKPDIDAVIADNIKATRDLADTITRYDETVTRRIDKAERDQDCEYDTPTLPQRRASDRW